MFACVVGNKFIIETLIEVGAQVDAVTTSGMTALMLCSTNGKDDCVEFLLTKQPNILLRNDKGKTALDLAKTPKSKKLLSNHLATLEKKANQSFASLVSSESPKLGTKKTRKKKKNKTSEKDTRKPIRPIETVESLPTNENHPGATIKGIKTSPIVIPHQQEETQHNDSDWVTVTGKKEVQQIEKVIKPKQVVSPMKSGEPLLKSYLSAAQVVIEEVKQDDTQDFQKDFMLQHPRVEDLDIHFRYFLGLGLNELSMSQIEVLEEMHLESIKKLNEAKIDLIRIQEQQRLEQKQMLAEMINNSGSKRSGTT
eukprot:TRINITY_DN3324_c0_g1_i2.p1 TRINITY_DN3324_c0_g1~~TRINITY_DN3324_c0_g1_i2.p1  ORF type:complete len:310 (-),score=75.49 TRINITY_DN3324_c0_g1_i2:158-1087(-)